MRQVHQRLPRPDSQTYMDNIGEIIGSIDLHDLAAPFLTISLGLHQPDNPSHTSIPGHRTDSTISPSGAYTHSFHPQTPIAARPPPPRQSPWRLRKVCKQR